MIQPLLIAAWRPVFPQESHPGHWLLQESEIGKPIAEVHRVSTKDWRGSVAGEWPSPVGKCKDRNEAISKVHGLLGVEYPMQIDGLTFCRKEQE